MVFDRQGLVKYLETRNSWGVFCNEEDVYEEVKELIFIVFFG